MTLVIIITVGDGPHDVAALGIKIFFFYAFYPLTRAEGGLWACNRLGHREHHSR